MADATQRRIIEPFRQRRTFRVKWAMPSLRFSIGFVLRRVRHSAPESLWVSNSTSGRCRKLHQPPAVRDPTHVVEFGALSEATASEP